MGCQNEYDGMDHAYELYSENYYDQALEELARIKDVTKSTKLDYKEASLLEGQILTEICSLIKAETSYKETLIKESNLNRLVRKLKKRLLGIDPKLRIEYEANINLSRLLCDQGRYQESLNFLENANEKMGFVSCGLGLIEQRFERDTLFVRNYLELGEVEPILERLGGEIFKEKNSSIVKEISDLILEEYSRSEIQNFLTIALKSIKTKGIREGMYPKEYSLTWFGREVTFQDVEIQDFKTAIDSATGSYYMKDLNNDELIEICREVIKKSQIYKELEI